MARRARWGCARLHSPITMACTWPPPSADSPRGRPPAHRRRRAHASPPPPSILGEPMVTEGVQGYPSAGGAGRSPRRPSATSPGVQGRRRPLAGGLGGVPQPSSSSHITLLAADEQGYRNLCRGCSAWRDRISRRARRARSRAAGEHSAGLIALSGGRDGPVAAPLLAGQPEARSRRGRLAARRVWSRPLLDRATAAPPAG